MQSVGIQIGVDGEAAFTKSLQNIVQKSKELASELKAVKSGYEDNGKSSDALKSKIDVLNKQISNQQTYIEKLKQKYDAQKAAVDQTRQAIDKAAQEYGENSAEVQKLNTQLDKQETALSKTATQINKAETALNGMNGELKESQTELDKTSGLMGKLEKASEGMGKVGEKMTSVGKTLTATVTAPILGLGAAIIKTSADFESQMDKVGAISGATGDDMDKLNAKAREMGEKTKFSATEAGQGFEYMAMAGWKTEDMLSGIEGIMNLAAASGEDLGTTSDIVTDALTAFGLSADDSAHFADILASASSNANTNVSMLGESFKYAAPVAGSLGISAEDTSVALGLMANAGIKASQAGTSLRTGLTNMAKPTKQMAMYMEKYGIELQKNDDGSVNLQKTMEHLRERMSGLSETEQAAAASAIFGKNSMAGWLSIVNSSEEDFNKLTGAIANCDGTAEEMAANMNDNLAGQIAILKSQLQELALSLGEHLVPVISKIVGFIQGIVNDLNSLDAGTKQVILTIAGIVAAVGPVLLVLGTVLTTSAKLVMAIETLSKAGTVLTPIIGGISAPVLGVVAAMAAAVVAGVLLYKNWDKVKEFATKTWAAIKKTVVDKVTEIKTKVTEGFTKAKETVTTNMTLIKTTLSNAWNTAKTTVTNLVNGIKTNITNAFSGAKENVLSIISGLKTSAETTFTNFKTKVSTIVTGIKSAIEKAFNDAKTKASTAINGLKTKVTSTISGLASSVKTKFNNIKNAIVNPITNAKNKVKSMIDSIKRIMSGSISFPKIKLPHFSWTWKDVGGVVKVPKISVDWYDKGGIFNSPSVIGVGERRPEFVGALDDLRKIVREEAGTGNVVINVYGAAGQDESVLAEKVMHKFQHTIQRGSAVFA